MHICTTEAEATVKVYSIKILESKTGIASCMVCITHARSLGSCCDSLYPRWTRCGRAAGAESKAALILDVCMILWEGTHTYYLVEQSHRINAGVTEPWWEKPTHGHDKHHYGSAWNTLQGTKQ